MKVLVVDNDHDTADTLAMLLKFASCEVRVAYDGEAALAEAEHAANGRQRASPPGSPVPQP